MDTTPQHGLTRDGVFALWREHEVFPLRIAEKFPHVLAQIVGAWDSREAADACFANLMIADPRRKLGFPGEVMSEILKLARVHDQIYRHEASPFDLWTRALEESDGRREDPAGG